MILTSWLICSSTLLFGQKEFNTWHFGIRAGISFNTLNPTSFLHPNSFNSANTGASISSKNSGKLLFYTNGNIIWDSSHSQMMNGWGNTSKSIVGNVGHTIPIHNTNQYISFSIDKYSITGPPIYSIIDMNWNNGLGAVLPTFKDLRLPFPTSANESICSYKKINGKDYWVTFQDRFTHDLYSYSVRSNKIDSNSIRTVLNLNDTLFTSAFSKYSPNGKKCVIVGREGVIYGFIVITDFDRRTATCKHWVTRSLMTTMYRGVEFSSNSKFLYLTQADTLFRVNISSSDSSTIWNSHEIIATIPSNRNEQFLGLQLGLDNKIYVSISRWGVPGRSFERVGRINNPDEASLSMLTYQDTALILQPNSESIGYFPSIHASFFRPLKFENACEGEVFRVSISDTVSLDSAKYDFGDASSGSRNFGFGVSDTHTFSSSGQYLLTTIMYYTDLNGGVQIDSLWDSIYVIPSPKIQLLTTSDTLLCKGDSLFASESNSPEYDFLWYDSSYAAFHRLDSSGTYWIAASNRCGVDTQHFNVHILQRQLNLRSDSIICHGDSILLAITDTPATYRWSNVSLDSSIWVSSSGKHWGEMTNLCGTFSDTVQVFVDSIPSPDLGIDTSVCKDALLFFSASASGQVKPRSYLWNSGDTFSQVIVKSPGLHWVQVSNACGVGSDSVLVSYLPAPSFSISPDSAFCSGDSIQLSFSGLVNHAGIFDKPKPLWSNGSTDSTIWMSDFGWVSLQLTNQCGIGVDSLLVTELLKPGLSIPADTILCNGTNLLLSVSTPKASYRWQDNSTNPVFSIASGGVYAVTVTNPCGMDSGSIRVVYQEEPTLSLSSEPNTPVCVPSLVNLLSSASGGGLSYLWSTGDSYEKIAVTNPGTYSLTVTNHCGVTSLSIAAPFVDLKADFVLDKTEGEAPLVVIAQNASVGAQSFSWYLDGDPLSNIKLPTSNIQLTKYGPHTLMLIVKNGSCSDTTAQEIEVLKNKNLPPRLCDFEIRPNPILTGSANVALGQQFFILAQNSDKQVREIKIMNISGAVICQSDVSHWKENPFFWQSPEVNLSLASGTYLVGLVCENETFFKRLVVE